MKNSPNHLPDIFPERTLCASERPPMLSLLHGEGESSLIVVINLLNRSFQGFDAGVAVDTPDRLIPKFTSRYCHSTIGIAVVLSVLA